MQKHPTEYTILAIETSCDETAAAVVRGGRTIVANVVASQLQAHQQHGGIVPEIASRQHIRHFVPVVQEALGALEHGWDDVDAVAATYGPGLSGALLTGLNGAKAMAWQRGLPFVGVNHIEAHMYANWLVPSANSGTAGVPSAGSDTAGVPQFPFVTLVVSGGHTILALVRGHGHYEVLGQTRDDAAGEAFDKVARILELGYPGGPAIEQAAQPSEKTMTLPRAWLRNTYDFSFSGLKTAVLHKVQERQNQAATIEPVAPDTHKKRGGTTKQQKSVSDAHFIAHIAYAFQESVVDVLVTKTIRAAHQFEATEILLAGGVAANKRLREELTSQADIPVRCPPIALCTDNAAMVGAAAYYRFHDARSGWNLDVEPHLALGA